MTQFFQIHPENPQKRLIDQAVTIIRNGGVVAYPTDSGYALGCHLGDKKAIEKIKWLRSLDDRHNFTLVCSDLSEISTYAKFDNVVFRMLKNHTPGPYTFILNATSEVPRLLLHPKRRSIGVRVPDHRITHALLEALGSPLMSVTLIPVEEELPLTDPEDIRERFGAHLDLIIDGGACSLEPTTVVDLREQPPTIVREGRGDTTPFTG
ncbi:L-threonylcarbamoyladenylate synthase [Modicisalibacter xianhensis]|uniref:tRNA threonylcarbamoyl adenosine modification protein (Sua5/YciO/YrdC/YwlC family) n=1 Tax=Modicisalibacter xianhensis TaxID=442341 RepID=A0A1I3ARJ4_9GAMM|nr:L-threonylcarbamoyladenylate synthase [Halomonas xianhensis]TDX29862.1 tRNA threonylcarbamoyl adenosine modification protein (Sua5/YciO/YrdC/YwlC family) [Halomonas xianhensis]SFH52396.1 tRNA threonylcarbamoyl adenosine modification protein, Sua5/YciO/YrdC/YwlC family [Halomonas xianhensis]